MSSTAPPPSATWEGEGDFDLQDFHDGHGIVGTQLRPNENGHDW